MSTRSTLARVRALSMGMILASAAAFVSVSPATAASAPASGGSIIVSNYTAPTVQGPWSITEGPDGALWFTNVDNASIGRITTSGVITNVYSGATAPDIATGPDGALWFTTWGGSIGRMTTAGAVTTYEAVGVEASWGITAGPDGALWFTDGQGSSIGRITVDGSVTTYSDPSIQGPGQITAGPDGALWFTNAFSNSIGRITTTGAVTSYADPALDSPGDITNGPDGALWFTGHISGASAIGRITTDGTIRIFTDPGISCPSGITSGPDGALWFTNCTNSIGRITTSGVVTDYSDPSIKGPNKITPGPDGALWFANGLGDSIGRIGPGEPTVVPGGGSVVEGNAGTSELQVPVALSNPSTDEVTVQWNTAFVGVGSPIEADPATDYAPASGTVTFAPGETHKTASITVNGDVLVEPDEWLLISFHDATNATIGGYGGLGFGLIKNDDHASIVPGGGSVVEGDAGTSELEVGVALSNPSVRPVTVQWRTAYLGGASGLEANPASDYTAAGGTVTFAPGETAKTVPITINGDTLVEPDEWIIVSFHDATNATIGGYGGLGFGVITNDDAP